jgi:hypothetical protein
VFSYPKHFNETSLIPTLQCPHHKTLTGLQTLYQHTQLIIQLLALCTAVLRLASHACNDIVGKINDFDGREDVVEFVDDVRFHGLDRDIVDESFECDLTIT